MPEPTETAPLLDPDCRDGKCGSCVGGPCEHFCHVIEAERAQRDEVRARLEEAERRILPAAAVPVPADGPVLCLCGNPDNCSCPPAPVADQEPLDLAAYRADIDRAHTEVGDIARAGYRRWRMSIPARPDRDSDLLISTGLRRGERLADEVERLRAALAEARAAAEQFAAEGNQDLARFNQYRELTHEVVAEREALNACIRATCSAARIAREVGDHRKVVLLSDVERLLTVPELPPLSPPDGGQ